MRYLLLLSLCCGLIACQKEQYKTDRSNRMTKKAKHASGFLANQAINLTQENIDNRDKTEKVSRRKLQKQQAALNEANSKSSKVKKQKMHSGNFIFY